MHKLCWILAAVMLMATPHASWGLTFSTEWIKQLDTKLDRLDMRLDRLEKKLDSFRKQIDELGKKLNRIEKSLDVSGEEQRTDSPQIQQPQSR
jgi:peptidoglycan hydrolase CwlO-like protein